MRWTSFNLAIEPMSMRRIDPQQQQQTATMVLQLATTIAPAIIQFPFMNWPEILDLVGEAYNIPDLARLIFNALGLQLIQQGMAPPGASGGMQLAAMGAPMNMLPKPASGGGQGPRGAAAGPARGQAGGQAGAGRGSLGAARQPASAAYNGSYAASTP